MRARLGRAIGAFLCGCCFQMAGCQANQIGEIVARNFKNTAVEIGTFVIESVVDDALGLE